MRLFYLLGVPLLWMLVSSPWVWAQNDSGPEGVKPIAVWHFDGADEPGVSKKALGKERGPSPPNYPGFAASNGAYRFQGSGITIAEKDVPHSLRFAQGETITLSAWVRVQQIKNGHYVYLIGKGRTRANGFPEKNQNYALRLFAQPNGVAISFLFASQAKADQPAEWHRWTSSSGFVSNTQWHHVAVRYTFGKPDSILGIVDGKKVDGKWDMGGATTRPPVVDGDDLQLGTGNGGGESNTFNGWLDDVTLWRSTIPEATLLGMYQFIPPPPVIALSDLPAKKVLVQLCEQGMPESNAWPMEQLQPTETYHEDLFGFFEVPHKYVETGVRGDRGNPYLFRAAAKVTLPKGKHRLLLRGRGATRLFVDNQLLLSTPFPIQDGSGHNPVIPAEKYLNLGPDFRFAPPGNREAWTVFESTGKEQFILLESIVGGFIGKQKRRPELGEIVVAWSAEGTETWQLLSPGDRSVPYTDDGWNRYQAERQAHYDRVNATQRAAKRAEHADYWQRRRTAANDWLRTTDDVPVPTLPKGFPAHNPIDHFLAETLDRVVRQKTETNNNTIDYFTHVQPILEAKCLGCHAGGSAKGKLRLDDLASALLGGKNDGPAIVPHRPKESSLLARVRSTNDEERMPPKGEPLTAEQIQTLETWIREGAVWPEFKSQHTTITPLTDDLAFLRRVYLSVVGVVPTLAEIEAFEKDTRPNKRARWIDQLLNDPRYADHQMGYWLDVLAENPNILNPTLNNTGPFRWWLYESFLDNKPFDFMVTELIRMQGSERFGGPAGFRIASQNDAPFAQKGTILSAAFLGIEMKCARCHDAPAHHSTQKDLFELAGMLANTPQKVLASSSVPLDKLHEGSRKPLIQVTLPPGATVAPRWPFEKLVPESVGTALAQDPKNQRDQLAAILTAPANERFAQVIVNRIWSRLMGRGLVEPVDDWEKSKASHPALLRWLAREFVRSGYDAKAVMRIILNSHAYQRQNAPQQKEPSILYAAPAARRLTAEQIVDSLFVASGKPMRVEEASLDIDGMRDLGNSISLGQPRRSWMLTSTSNERDRPSLSLPRLQAVADVLISLGWRETRQDPTSVRDHLPNVRQPAILSNGIMSNWLTRLSDDHAVTTLALRAKSPEEMVDQLVLAVLTRRPTAEERKQYTEYLEPLFAERIQTPPARSDSKSESGSTMKSDRPKRMPIPYVSWSNHLDPKSTILRQEQEAAARRGDPATERLDPHWRERAEDLLWALLNAPEFLFTP